MAQFRRPLIWNQPSVGCAAISISPAARIHALFKYHQKCDQLGPAYTCKLQKYVIGYGNTPPPRVYHHPPPRLINLWCNRVTAYISLGIIPSSSNNHVNVLFFNNDHYDPEGVRKRKKEGVWRNREPVNMAWKPENFRKFAILGSI